MNFTICEYFLLFIIYSFFGWIMEVVCVSIQNKRLINRGFLLGPYCPIYGLGALFITIALARYSYDPLVLFVMSVLLCCILEYITSWAMEVLFKARWWDYSDQKFNVNGRVCFKNLLAFGVLGLLVIYVLNPKIMGLLEVTPTTNLNVISIIILIIFIIDTIISFIVIFGFRNVTKNINIQRKEDNTEQITKMVRELFSQKSFFHRRFINAYPKLEAIKIKIKEIKEKIQENVNDAKGAVNEKKEQIKSTFNESTRHAKIHVYLSKKKIKSKLRGKNFIKKED